MSTKEGRGGGVDIFPIKPLQPALLMLYCTTNLCPKKTTLLFGYNASVCLAQSSTVQLRLFLSWYSLHAGSYDGCIVKAFISYSIKSLLCTLHWLTLYIVRWLGVLCGRLIDRDIVRGRLTATWLVAAIVSESSSSIIPVVIILVILGIIVIWSPL